MKAKTASDIAASKMKMASEEENRTDAQLNRVKMAKEVDQMDVNNMLGLADRVLKINELLQQRQEAGGVGNRLTVKR